MHYSFDIDVVQKFGSVNSNVILLANSTRHIVKQMLIDFKTSPILGHGKFSPPVYSKENCYDSLCLHISFHPVYRKLIRLYDKYDRKRYLKNMDPISLSMIKTTKHEILKKKVSYVDSLARKIEETPEWQEFMKAKEEYNYKVFSRNDPYKSKNKTKKLSKSFISHLENKMIKAWRKVIYGVLRDCVISVRAEFIEYFEKRLFEIETFIDNSNFC